MRSYWMNAFMNWTEEKQHWEELGTSRDALV